MAITSLKHGTGSSMRFWLINGAGLTTTVLTMTIIAYVFVGGTIRKSAALAQEQVTLTAQLEHLTELANTLGQGKETLGMLEVGMQDIDSRLPMKMDLEEFYRALMTLATDNNVRVYEMLPGELDQGESFISMPIALSANADFEDFYHFAFDLRNFDRLTKVDALTIAASPEDSRCSISMTLRIYSAKESTAGGSLEQ